MLFHGYDCAAKNHKSTLAGTCGNAWITVATPMIMKEIGGMTNLQATVGDSYKRLVDGLIGFQAAMACGIP